MIKARRKSIRDDIDESWLTDSENRSVELNELIIAAELSDLSSLTDLNDLSDLILSISICWYCEISATWLIEKQNRNVELSELIETANLNDLNRLIDDLIELYSLAFVNDVSTRIFLLIWSTSAATRYFDSNQSIEARFLILDLINDVKFVSSAICEILASWLIEKQIRNVELSLLSKMLNLKFLNDLSDLNSLIDDSIAIRRYCEVSAVRLTEK